MIPTDLDGGQSPVVASEKIDDDVKSLKSVNYNFACRFTDHGSAKTTSRSPCVESGKKSPCATDGNTFAHACRYAYGFRLDHRSRRMKSDFMRNDVCILYLCTNTTLVRRACCACSPRKRVFILTRRAWSLSRQLWE